MQKHQGEHSLAVLANALDVTRSGFYAWRKSLGQDSPRKQAQQALDAAVAECFRLSKGRYGAERLQVDLLECGRNHDIKTIRASMKRQGLAPKAAQLFKVTTDSNHSKPVAPNLLEQDFSAEALNQKWAGDITYLYTNEGWLYLAVIIDLFSRAVIGWSMSERMTANLVNDALLMALWKRKFPEGVIVHSDQGSQYASDLYRQTLASHGLIQSMSRKGNCWDNACVESFFHSMKVEAIIGEPLPDRKSMRQRVFEYIEVDYNRTRRHSALGFVSPEAYEEENLAKSSV
jgi:transposase InsO family protein